MAEGSITCPQCGKTSHNPDDVREGYCGRCHAFTSPPQPSSQQNDRSPDTQRLYAWLARDADGIQGIIVAPVGDMILPLVFADEDRAQKYVRYAAWAARQRKMPAELVMFTRGETLRTIER